MKAENIELVNSEKVENYAERKRVEEKESAKRPADYDGRGRFLMADVKAGGNSMMGTNSHLFVTCSLHNLLFAWRLGGPKCAW